METQFLSELPLVDIKKEPQLYLIEQRQQALGLAQQSCNRQEQRKEMLLAQL